VENKKFVYLLQATEKFYQIAKVNRIEIFVKQTVPRLEMAVKIVGQNHDPVVKKNFIHLQNENR
jgi:hypothetical protein